MLSLEQKKSLFGQLDVLKAEIDGLRKELLKADKEKESFFDEKKTYSDDIRKSIGILKDSRSIRDTLTKHVKADKEERGRLNRQIKEKSSELNALRDERKDFLKKLGVRHEPSRIRREIEIMEFKLETEPVSFEKETEARGRIRAMKALLQKTKAAEDAAGHIKEMSAELHGIRSKAQETHNRIQKNADISQEKHKVFIEASKKLDETRPKEDDMLKKFISAKKRFMELNQQLNDKLQAMARIRAELDNDRVQTRKMIEESEAAEIKRLEMNVELKLKQRKKITTEDLLVFQNRK